MALHGGTLTFLFTDIVGSTALWEEHAEVMGDLVPMHDGIIAGAVEARGGKVFKTVGDAVCAVFDTATDAVSAAVDSQGLLAAYDWPAATGHVAVRMGIHTGVAQRHGESDYLGPTLNRVARIVDAGHGGQILVSESARSLIDDPCVDLGRHQLKGLARSEQIYQVEYGGGPSEFPPLRTSLAAAAGNLPLDLEPMFGRSADLESVVAAMETRRLVTLTGTGGVGKTKLALGAATEFDGRSARHGVWLVALAPLAAGSDIYSTIASTLSIQAEGGRSLSDAVMAALVSRESLLVLDNAEHVLESTRDFASRVVASCPSIRLLVTSRESLGVRGEQVLRVPPLAALQSGVGGSPGPAVELLQHRIALGGSATDSSQDSVDALVRLANRLDGLPLALELAAARSAVMGVEGLIARLDGQLDVLSDRTAPDARHATLRATIDWSHELLDEEQREVFRRFSVFANGCTLEAAEAVCAGSESSGTSRGGHVLDVMEHLTAASMVEVEIDELGRTRFTMLESLRQFGQLQLDMNDENASARDAHGAYYRDLAARTAEGIRKSDIEAVRTVEIEIANFRAAHGWGLTTDNPALYLEIPARFGFWYYQMGRNDEMASWLVPALERESASTSPLFAVGLSIAAEATRVSGDVARHEEYVSQLTALASSQQLPYDAKAFFRNSEFYRGRTSLEEREADLEASSYDAHDECQNRLLLSLTYTYQRGDAEQATKHATRMLALAERHELAPQRAWALYSLAEACQATEPERARVMLDEAVTISQDWNLMLVNGVSRVSLATATMQLGRMPEAARILSDLINEWHLRGNWQHQWVALRNAVELLAEVGQPEVAANLLRAIENSPSSGEVFGAQGDRLAALAAKFPSPATIVPLSDDQIVRLGIEALDEAAQPLEE